MIVDNASALECSKSSQCDRNELGHQGVRLSTLRWTGNKKVGSFFSILLNELLKTDEPEAYESVRRRGLANENAAGGHFQHPARLLKMAFSKAARNQDAEAYVSVR
jgi:hypothetical protein